MSDSHWYHLNSVSWGMLSESLGASAQHAEPTICFLHGQHGASRWLTPTWCWHFCHYLLKVANEIYSGILLRNLFRKLSVSYCLNFRVWVLSVCLVQACRLLYQHSILWDSVLLGGKYLRMSLDCFSWLLFEDAGLTLWNVMYVYHIFTAYLFISIENFSDFYFL